MNAGRARFGSEKSDRTDNDCGATQHQANDPPLIVLVAFRILRLKIHHVCVKAFQCRVQPFLGTGVFRVQRFHAFLQYGEPFIECVIGIGMIGHCLNLGFRHPGIKSRIRVNYGWVLRIV